MTIDKRTDESVYINLNNGTTVYVDDSTNEGIVSVWKEGINLVMVHDLNSGEEPSMDEDGVGCRPKDNDR